jgi:hypothetical protein
MKTGSDSIAITVSDALAQRLEEFSRVAMTTVDEIVDYLFSHQLVSGTVPLSRSRLKYERRFSSQLIRSFRADGMKMRC